MRRRSQTLRNLVGGSLSFSLAFSRRGLSCGRDASEPLIFYAAGTPYAAFRIFSASALVVHFARRKKYTRLRDTRELERARARARHGVRRVLKFKFSSQRRRTAPARSFSVCSRAEQESRSGGGTLSAIAKTRLLSGKALMDALTVTVLLVKSIMPRVTRINNTHVDSLRYTGGKTAKVIYLG